MKKIICAIFLFYSLTVMASDKEVFNAMNAEIQRAMEHLKIEGMESPYFISLRMQDTKLSTIFSSFGSLVQDSESPYRQVTTEVRVGSPALDNTNFDPGWEYSSSGSASADVPFEDDVTALRQVFWLVIDDTYKKNLQILSKKKGYLEKHPQEDYPADFLPAPEKTEIILPPLQSSSIDLYRPYVQKISQHLKSYPFLTQGNVSLSIFNMVQYYADSEGSHDKRPDQYLKLTISIEAYTQDWYPIRQYLSWIARTGDELPKQEKAFAEIAETANYLKSLLTQKPLEEYTGPVVFMGPAAGKFFLDLLGKGITRAREPLSAFGGNPSQYNGFLAKRFGLRILPKSYEVWDKPNEKEFNGKTLAGSMAVDDEGVKSKDIALIKNGKLVGLPMQRTATKKFSEVNGHARGSINSTPNSAITNLFIEDKNGVPRDAFMNAIKEAAADQGVDQVLMVSSLKDETNASDSDEFLSMFGSGSRTRLSSPAQMLLYNVKTGEKKPIWGLEFSNVDEKNLKNIIASSKDQTLYQSSGYASPVSIIAPDVLIEEITLEKTKLEKLRTPTLPMPDLK